jgi:hypothetical protein
MAKACPARFIRDRFTDGGSAVNKNLIDFGSAWRIWLLASGHFAREHPVQLGGGCRDGVEKRFRGSVAVSLGKPLKRLLRMRLRVTWLKSGASPGLQKHRDAPRSVHAHSSALILPPVWN